MRAALASDWASGFSQSTYLPAFSAVLAGTVLLAIGLVQLVRRRSAIFAFVGAMALFGLCLGLYVGLQQMNESSPVPQPVPLNAAPWPSLSVRETASAVPETAKKPQVDAPILPPGTYSLPAPAELAANDHHREAVRTPGRPWP